MKNVFPICGCFLIAYLIVTIFFMSITKYFNRPMSDLFLLITYGSIFSIAFGSCFYACWDYFSWPRKKPSTKMNISHYAEHDELVFHHDDELLNDPRLTRNSPEKTLDAVYICPVSQMFDLPMESQNESEKCTVLLKETRV